MKRSTIQYLWSWRKISGRLKFLSCAAEAKAIEFDDRFEGRFEFVPWMHPDTILSHGDGLGVRESHNDLMEILAPWIFLGHRSRVKLTQRTANKVPLW